MKGFQVRKLIVYAIGNSNGEIMWFICSKLGLFLHVYVALGSMLDVRYSLLQYILK